MKTKLLTKKNFLKHMGMNTDWSETNPTYYCYICEKVFDTKTAQYIYGALDKLTLASVKDNAKLFLNELEKIKEEMWELALTERAKNPKLTHLLALNKEAL